MSMPASPPKCRGSGGFPLCGQPGARACTYCLQAPLEAISALFGCVSSAFLCEDRNYKHPTWNSRADNSNGHILEAYTDEHGLCVLGPQQPTHLATTGTMDVLDITIHKDIRLTTVFEDLHELFSEFLSPQLFTICERGTHQRQLPVFFTGWDKYADVLGTTLPPCSSLSSTPALLDDAIALFEPH
jgi:hypothetical protein